MLRWIKKGRFASLARFVPWRLVIIGGLVAAAVGYGIFGWELSEQTATMGAKSETERLLEEQAKNNPALADDLARLRADYGDVAVATKLKLDARAAGAELETTPLAVQIERGEPVHEAALVNLVQVTGMRPEDPALETFLASYDEAVRITPDPSERAAVLASLQAAARSAEDWQYIKEGYHALLVWQATHEQSALWDLYKKEHEWLPDVIMQRLMLDMTTFSDFDDEIVPPRPQERVRTLLDVAARHGDLIKAIYEESEEQAVLAYHVFEMYGDTLAVARERYGLPLVEALEVVYANPGTLDDYAASRAGGDPIELQAAFLSDVYKQHPNVWMYAQTTPLALQLFLDARVSADAVLDRYGDNPGFLMQLYEAYGTEEGENDLLITATAALEQYEDVAALLLFDYRDNAAFQNALVNPEIGTRIIPYAARFPETIAEASQDPGYVNKYFDEDGRLKDPDRWWEAVPGGSIVKVLSNMKNGYPCDWSEMGWAAFDAADIGLMLVTVGTSKAITSGAKVAVKGSVQAVRLGAKSTSLARRAGGKLIGLMRRTAGSADNVAHTTARASGSTLKRASVRMRQFSDDLVERIGRASSPQHIKKWRRIGYALAVGKLVARLDLASKAPEQLTASAVHAGAELMKIPGKMLGEAFKEVMASAGVQAGGLPLWLVHGGIVLVLLAIAALVWRVTQPRHVTILKKG